MRDPQVRRRWEYRLDFIRSVVGAQLRAEFDQYLLGWLWWILEPVMQALTFFLVVALFFHLEGDRLWVIMISVIAWRWFSRTIDTSPHLARQFGPYTRTGGVSAPLLFVTFLAKETVVFLIALVVILIPIAFFAHPFTLHLPEVLLIILAQGLVTFWVSTLALFAGAAIHDVGKVIGLAVSIWFYFSPGIYLRTDVLHLPAWVLTILSVNPFWAILTSWQNVVVRGEGADYQGLAAWIVVSVVLDVGALLLLRRSRRALARVAFE